MREIAEKERPVAVKDWPKRKAAFQLPPLAPNRRNRGFPWFLLISILVLAGASIFAVTKIRPKPEQVLPEEVAVTSPLAIATTIPQPAEEQVRARTEPDRVATMESRLTQAQPQTQPETEAAVLEAASTPVLSPWPKVENFVETGQDEAVQEAIQAFKTVEPKICADVGQLMVEVLRNTHYENLEYLPRLLRMAQVAEWLLGQPGIKDEFQQRISAETSAAEKALAERLRQPTTFPTVRPTATLPNPTPAGRTVLFAIPPELGIGFSPIALLQEVEFLLKRKSSTQWKVTNIIQHQIGPFTTYDIELQEIGSINRSWVTGMSDNLKIDQTIDIHSVIKLILESIKNRFP